MVGHGARIMFGEILLPIQRLVLHIQSYLVVIAFRQIVSLTHKAPNLRPVELNQLYHILYKDFMVSYTMVFLIRGRMNVLDIDNLVIFRGSVR